MSQVPNSPPPQYIDNGANLPEVVSPGQHPYADGPQVINSGPQHAPELYHQYGNGHSHPYQGQQQYDTSPEVTYSNTDYKGGTVVPGPGAVPHEGSAANHGAGAEGATKPIPFWRRKRMMLLAAGVVLLVIVGAVVGGVVGSQKAKSSAGADSATSPAQGVSPPGSSPTPSTTPVAVSRRPGTVATTSRGVEVFTHGIQLFWQDEGSPDITYSVYNNGLDYGPLRQLNLSRPPKGATPLAATSWFVDNNRTNNASVQLYYLLETNSAGRLDIAMADLVCTRQQACTETGTTIISANVTAEVASNSDLTAVWRRDQKNFKYNNRVYYQAKGTGSLIELSGDTATTTGWAETDLKAQAQNGSSLASVFADGYSMELYYLDTTGALTGLVNTDHWASPTQIKADSGDTGAAGTGVIEACWENSSNIFRIYRATDKGNLVEYNRKGVGSSWAAGMSPNGRAADSTFTVSSWDADVRLFFVEKGVMTRGTRGTTSWKMDAVKDI
ncbi:hypothetical protein Micbo1qcDRAFT_237132 [Microdochium bolleyi]|uniref:Fucose-specific lectin n=1 Tax=Microdochium bolleyi TaxID=196109 RepID=A0A136IMP3_9PEZI|nr:hypothetical protein Micbo1qcDRAFT_237132 [Microdochium bolleyi]